MVHERPGPALEKLDSLIGRKDVVFHLRDSPSS
jgi:hypothetical protein